jgi:hypothetical protein
MCGSKLVLDDIGRLGERGAAHAGPWIETTTRSSTSGTPNGSIPVRERGDTGNWIDGKARCRSKWECGSKQFNSSSFQPGRSLRRESVSGKSTLGQNATWRRVRATFVLTSGCKHFAGGPRCHRNAISDRSAAAHESAYRCAPRLISLSLSVSQLHPDGFGLDSA